MILFLHLRGDGKCQHLNLLFLHLLFKLVWVSARMDAGDWNERNMNPAGHVVLKDATTPLSIPAPPPSIVMSGVRDRPGLGEPGPEPLQHVQLAARLLASWQTVLQDLQPGTTLLLNFAMSSKQSPSQHYQFTLKHCQVYRIIDI